MTRGNESDGAPDSSSGCQADLARLRALTCIKWSHYPDDVLAAWVADMDIAPAPVAVEAVRALVERGDFGYNFAAHAQLPDAFSAWQERRHGWRPDVREGSAVL